MIGPHQLVTGIVAGTVLMLLGLVPGLFEGLVQGVHNLCNILASRLPVASDAEVRQPTWLAGVGAALIVATVLAYLST